MITFVLVNYRSTAEALRATESFRSAVAAAGVEAEVIAVDNSGDGDALRSAADRLVSPGRNLGFAGGLNAGAKASRGEVLFLGNPDLVFAPESVRALLDALEEAGDGTAAGPAFFHDAARTLLMPPAEEPSPLELARRLLSRDPAATERVFKRNLGRVLRVHAAARARRTLRAEALSGALVAMSRVTLERVGPFDERYRLYYEENDWQRRLVRSGGRLVYAGAAHVVHRWGQSARHEPQAAAWFAESERLYFGEHFGTRGRKGLDSLAAAPPWPKSAPPLLAGRLEWPQAGPAGIAVSPLPWFSPIGWVGLPAGASIWTPPPEFADLIPGPCYVRAVGITSAKVLAEATIAPRGASAAGNVRREPA